MNSMLKLAALALCGSTALAGGSEADRFLKEIGAPEGIEPAASHRPIVIAVVDDGLRASHRDLLGFIWTNPKETPGNPRTAWSVSSKNDRRCGQPHQENAVPDAADRG